MNQLSGVLSIVLGFVTVMAGVSMLVASFVGILHRLENRRMVELAEMLAATNFAFRSHYNDCCTPGDAATVAFVKAVLSDPVLRTANDLDKGIYERPDRPLEWITRKSLIGILEHQAPGGVLPASWHMALAPEVATVAVLKAWLARWFATIEANATDRFRKHSQRVSMVVAALLVVLINLDAIQLSIDLVTQSATASAVDAHAAGLETLANAREQRTPEESREELGRDLIQLNALLNVPALRLGWQHSQFIERYCAYRRKCATPTSITQEHLSSDGLGFLLYFARWLAGLLVSTILLWLGAPFWADRLRDLLRLRSTAAQNERRHKGYQPSPRAAHAGSAPGLRSTVRKRSATRQDLDAPRRAGTAWYARKRRR